MLHSSPWRFTKLQGWGGGIFFVLIHEKFSLQYIHYTYIPLAGTACWRIFIFFIFLFFKSSLKGIFFFIVCVLSAWLGLPGCSTQWFIAFYDQLWHFVWSSNDNLINCWVQQQEINPGIKCLVFQQNMSNIYKYANASLGLPYITGSFLSKEKKKATWAHQLWNSERFK